MKACFICGSKEYSTKHYDKHAADFRPKALIKRLLPYFDPLIPNSLPRLKKFSHLGSNPFKGTVRICLHCGHGMMETPPTPAEVERYYQQLYWEQIPSETMAAKNAAYEKDPRAQHQVEFSMSALGSREIKRVLEIGAGTAYASLLLRDKMGETVKLYACEPGEQWTAHYRHHHIEKIADYFPFETAQKFDYIHASHWLEHVLDLDATISKLREITSPSGHVFIEVPNTEHFYWDLPVSDTPHVHFFTQNSLRQAFEKHGFKCLKMGEYGITFREFDAGLVVPAARFGAFEKGFWIRALFYAT